MKYYKLTIPIGELFKILNIDNNLYEVIQTSDRVIKIKSPSGEYVNINAFVKKQGYVRHYIFEDNIKIKCDEKHLVKQNDGSFSYINNTNHVIVNNKIKYLCFKSDREYKDVYDISIDFPHEYITHDGIISHNTTLAKILSNNLNCDVKYINASDENSIDDIRTKVKSFASTIGFYPLKIMILDEADYLSPNAQAALRNLMETFSDSTRFILTCNYPEKIIDPIISRCQVFELIPPSKKEVAKHVATILNTESVKFESTDLAFLIKAYYPDIRKIVNNAQQYSSDGVLKINQTSVIASDYKLKILEILSNKELSKKDSFNAIRQLLADCRVSDFTDMYTLLYDSVDEYGKGNVVPIFIILGDMQAQSVYVVDKEISFMSCIIQILDKIK